MQEILRVERAVKYFGSGSAVTRALAGVSFSVEKGEFVAVMGASGSGKSTLLNVIAAIEPLSGGDVAVEGVSLAHMREKEQARYRRDRLGFIFQEYNLLDTLTARENIVLPLNLRRAGREYTRSALERVSGALGVGALLDKFPYELSGGERQRVACARAVITSPALILADEPTGALDSKNSRALMQLFCRMNAELGATILMVTHDAAVASYAGRALFLQKRTGVFQRLRLNIESKDMARLTHHTGKPQRVVSVSHGEIDGGPALPDVGDEKAFFNA